MVVTKLPIDPPHRHESFQQSLHTYSNEQLCRHSFRIGAQGFF